MLPEKYPFGKTIYKHDFIYDELEGLSIYSFTPNT
jgi:hypothetical protein